MCVKNELGTCIKEYKYIIQNIKKIIFK